MVNDYAIALSIIIGFIYMMYRCIVDSSPTKRLLYLIGIGIIFCVIVKFSIFGAKMNLCAKYQATYLRPSTQILTSVKTDIEKGEIAAAQAKIDVVISHLSNHLYYYEMKEIVTLPEKNGSEPED